MVARRPGSIPFLVSRPKGSHRDQRLRRPITGILHNHHVIVLESVMKNLMKRFVHEEEARRSSNGLLIGIITIACIVSIVSDRSEGGFPTSRT